jgi:hypothetical protein
MKRAVIIVVLIAILVGGAFAGVALAAGKPVGSGVLMEVHRMQSMVDGDQTILEQQYPQVRHVSVTLVAALGLDSSESVSVWVGIPYGYALLKELSTNGATSVEFDAPAWKIEVVEDENDANSIELARYWTVTYPAESRK